MPPSTGTIGGRIGKLIDVYTKTMLAEQIAGVEARSWTTFLKTYTDEGDPGAVWDTLNKTLRKEKTPRNEADALRLRQIIEEMADLTRGRRLD